MSTSGEQLSFSIINPEKLVSAMRDSGYKSTTHALAELIDNSIESHAMTIEVFGISEKNSKTNRHGLTKLAVLDNGEGMDALTLRGSLRYGHGTRRARRGIGRFGLGLPNSSMSQARRVDIWSWQSGVSNSFHTYLSLDEVENGTREIPTPELKKIPQIYLKSSRNMFRDSGTLVVWSDLDRVEWTQASTTFKHTEHLIGRIYRRFLAKDSDRLPSDDSRGDEIGSQRKITLIPIQENNERSDVDEKNIVEVRPNDPLYLMSGTSCPEDFGPGPMFKEIEGSPFPLPIEFEGTEYLVKVRASYACAHARDSSASEANWPTEWMGQDAGRTPWGKHANQNMGISLVRAHREIQLDDSWVSGDDPRERWWTVEVDFPTALDEVFGVTNNKQGALTFQRLSKFDWRREALADEESSGDVRRRMEATNDPRRHLLNLRKQIENAIKLLRRRSQESKQTRGKRHTQDEDHKADAKATATITRRIDDGIEGESDRSGGLVSKEEYRDYQIHNLIQVHHYDPDVANQEIDETILKGNLVRWIQSPQSSPAFFDVEPLPGVLQVALNSSHPVYSSLYEVLHPEVENMTEDEVRQRLVQVAGAFRLLIYSWARYEDEQSEKARRLVRNSRIEWGKIAEEFFDNEDDSIPPADLF